MQPNCDPLHGVISTLPSGTLLATCYTNRSPYNFVTFVNSIYVRDLLKTDPYLNRMLEPHRSTDMFQGVWLRHLSTNAPLLKSCILLPTLNACAQDSKCSSNDPVCGLGCRSDEGKDKVVLHSAF